MPPDEEMKTSIDEGLLSVFLDGEWHPVGPVAIKRFANATMVSVNLSTPEGKEAAALLDSLGYYKKKGEGNYLLSNAKENQHNPANEIPEGVMQVGNNLGTTEGENNDA